MICHVLRCFSAHLGSTEGLNELPVCLIQTGSSPLTFLIKKVFQPAEFLLRVVFFFFEVFRVNPRQRIHNLHDFVSYAGWINSLVLLLKWVVVSVYLKRTIYPITGALLLLILFIPLPPQNPTWSHLQLMANGRTIFRPAEKRFACLSVVCVFIFDAHICSQKDAAMMSHAINVNAGLKSSAINSTAALITITYTRAAEITHPIGQLLIHFLQQQLLSAVIELQVQRQVYVSRHWPRHCFCNNRLVLNASLTLILTK